MQSFIVLGIIPGTNIQTNLNFWVFVSFLYIFFLTRRFWYARAVSLRIRLVAWRLAHTFDHFE
jgi:hypothetical protein